MTPDKKGKILAEFNVKNGVYNVDGSSEVKSRSEEHTSELQSPS